MGWPRPHRKGSTMAELVHVFNNDLGIGIHVEPSQLKVFTDAGYHVVGTVAEFVRSLEVAAKAEPAASAPKTTTSASFTGAVRARNR
jgi:hypothetical protein